MACASIVSVAIRDLPNEAYESDLTRVFVVPSSTATLSEYIGGVLPMSYATPAESSRTTVTASRRQHICAALSRRLVARFINILQALYAFSAARPGLGLSC
jgi:hypothetical protein